MNASNYLGPFSERDASKMLSLIQEYAEKLRALCDAHIEEKARRQQFALLTVLTVFVMTMTLTFGLSSFTKLEMNPSLPVISISLTAVMASAAFAVLFRSSSRRSQRSYDMHQVASTVERLLRTASQYSEHASQRLGDKFEFDIRLAEAEAALRMYKEVFAHQEKDSFSFFN